MGGMTDAALAQADLGLDLVTRWPGPYGGLPPFGQVTPADLEAGIDAAIERKRAEVAAIVADLRAPDFANTVRALEASGRSLRNAESLLLAYAGTASVGGMPAARARAAAKLAVLEIEIAGNAALFGRIEHVYLRRGGLPAADARLTEIVHDRLVRTGARLSVEARRALLQIDEELARLQTLFSQNLLEDEKHDVVYLTDSGELDGLPADLIDGAAEEAARRGRPDIWAFANTRITAWGVQQHARSRDLRRRVRDMWMSRGAHDGDHDNRPVMAELVRLRGEKARLFGFPSFAHFQTATRMARTPDAAMAQLRWIWHPVLTHTERDLRDMDAIARADELEGPLEPWDPRYYGERLRRERFALDAEAVRAYLSLPAVLAMLMDVAERLHGISFTPLADAPRLHPDIQVFELRREGTTLAVIWFDLLRRDGKMQGAFQQQLRAAETFEGRVVPLALVSASLEPDPLGTVLLSWEYAKVVFHEFGHALHMLMSRAPYPSLGPMSVPWDMIELPSQLHERWLLDPALLRRFARHHQTGEPMPDAMIASLQAADQHERVTSLTLGYLVPAIVDLELYLAADGRAVDPMAIEARVHAGLGLPHAIDPLMRLPHQYHSSTDVYAAGVYVYLWADVMVADVLEAFLDAPGGLFDPEVAERWRETILAAGAIREGGEAFRVFRGRDPDPSALLRRFELA